MPRTIYSRRFQAGGKDTGIIGFIVSLAAAGFLMIGVLPFMGWFNWFTTLPAAVLGIVFSGVGMTRRKKKLAVAGLIIGLAVFILALVRLQLGGGIL